MSRLRRLPLERDVASRAHRHEPSRAATWHSVRIHGVLESRGLYAQQMCPAAVSCWATAGLQAAHHKAAAADLCTWNELLHLALQVVEHHIVPARVDNGVLFCKVQVAIDISPQAKGMSATQKRKMSLRPGSNAAM